MDQFRVCNCNVLSWIQNNNIHNYLFFWLSFKKQTNRQNTNILRMQELIFWMGGLEVRLRHRKIENILIVIIIVMIHYDNNNSNVINNHNDNIK